MRRSQALVTLLLIATFAAGVAGGVAVDRLWLRPSPAAGQADGSAEPDRHREKRDDDEKTVIERFSEELELTAVQEARIDTVLEHYRESMKELRREVRPRYDALVDSARRRIEAVLDSAQARAYRRLLERKDHDEEEEKHGEDRRKRR